MSCRPTWSDLQRARCIRLRFPSGVVYQWQFRREGSALSVPATGGLTVDDQSLALRAALDGLGWAYVYRFMAEPHLNDGRLVAALVDWCPAEPGFQPYYPGRRQVSLDAGADRLGAPRRRSCLTVGWAFWRCAAHHSCKGWSDELTPCTGVRCVWHRGRLARQHRARNGGAPSPG
ncbi:MAG: LysR substrate-binding domain-containing protein [Burkholderiaceae bacterium]